MSKKTRTPKSRDMQSINRRAFLSVNRAEVLTRAYMELSTAVIRASRTVEESEEADRPAKAYTALLGLLLEWQENDAMLAHQMQNIEQAVK